MKIAFHEYRERYYGSIALLFNCPKKCIHTRDREWEGISLLFTKNFIKIPYSIVYTAANEIPSSMFAAVEIDLKWNVQMSRIESVLKSSVENSLNNELKIYINLFFPTYILHVKWRANNERWGRSEVSTIWLLKHLEN